MRRFFLALCFISLSFASSTKIEDLSNLSIKTPDLKQRKTLKIRLDNGLEAYLISDPGLTESAALIAVNSGSLDNPHNALGLAHFLEHMLFMGTKKYPKEEDFATFIQDHGGTYNAFTGDDRTAYLFSIQNDYFPQAFDRLAQFFIDPLLSENCLQRERNAVDQEHGKNIENDAWRMYLILKELGNKDHPFSKFSTGTLSTLQNVDSSALQHHFMNHYSANLIKIVVYSPLPLEQLQNLVETNFSNLKNKNLVATDPVGQIFDDHIQGKLIYLEPVKDLKTLNIIWQLPKQFANDKTFHFDAILDYIFTSNEPNSLLYKLKEEELVDAIKIDADVISSSNVLMTIEMKLTEKGVTETTKILSLLNQALLSYSQQNLPRSVFEDVKRTKILDWEYQLRQDGFQTLYKDAHFIFNEDLSTFPQQSLIPSQYDSQSFKRFVSDLNLENAVIVLQAPKEIAQKPLEYTEKWTNAKYSILPFDWQAINESRETEFTFPNPNPYLPSSLPEMKAQPYSEPQTTIIEDSDYGKVYFVPDTAFFIPKTALFLRINTPKATSTLAKLQAMTHLYIKAFYEKQSVAINQAQNAGFEVGLTAQEKGLTLLVKGWQTTIEPLMKELIHGMQNLHISKVEFENYKQLVLSSLNNFSKEMPCVQGIAITKKAFLPGSHLPTELAKSLITVSYEDFEQFISSLFNQLYIEAIVFGGINKESATTWKNEWISSFRAKPYPPSRQRNVQVVILPDNKGPFELVHKVDLTNDATILSIQQGSELLKEEVMQQLMTQILHPLFFEQLRTKQQTGYIARVLPLRIENQLLTTMLVQSKTHSANDLLARFDLFLEDILKNFTSFVDETRFESIKQAFIQDYSQPLQTLDAAMQRLTSLAFDYQGDFERINKKIKILNSLNYEQIQAFATTFLSKDNKRRLAVLVKGQGEERNDYKRLKNTAMLQKIGRLSSFKTAKMIQAN